MPRTYVKCQKRRLWGVLFTGSLRRDASVLIGRGWSAAPETPYPGEPTRPLLFTTRAVARAWCKAKEASYEDRQDLCTDWRFRAVRVRETVTVEREK